jgi:hypothetical protein
MSQTRVQSWDLCFQSNQYKKLLSIYAQQGPLNVQTMFLATAPSISLDM